MGTEWEALGLGKAKGAAAEYKPVNFGGVIELAKGRRSPTFDHELWHHIEHWLLTPKERAALVRDFGKNEEARAIAYETWNPKEAPHTIFQKILDFFQRILKALTGKVSGEDVFAKARSGELFGREPMERRLPEGLAPTKLRLAERTPEEREADRRAREEVGIPEYKDFKAELDKDDGALYERLIAPGSREIPLYEGERYYGNRAGNMIVDEKGKMRTLSKREIWERFYDPQKPLLEAGEETPRDPRVAPEGAVEPPPNRTILRSFREKFASAGLSEKSDLAHQSVVEHLGWSAREMVKASNVLDKYMDRFGKMTQEDLLAFTDAVESGRMQDVAPDLQEAAQAWRRLSDGLHFLVTDVKGGEFAYWTDYFPRLFKNPEQAQIAIEQYLKGRGRTDDGARRIRQTPEPVTLLRQH